MYNANKTRYDKKEQYVVHLFESKVLKFSVKLQDKFLSTYKKVTPILIKMGCYKFGIRPSDFVDHPYVYIKEGKTQLTGKCAYERVISYIVCLKLLSVTQFMYIVFNENNLVGYNVDVSIHGSGGRKSRQNLR